MKKVVPVEVITTCVQRSVVNVLTDDPRAALMAVRHSFKTHPERYDSDDIIVMHYDALLPQNGEPIVIEVDDDDVSILDDLLCD